MPTVQMSVATEVAEHHLAMSRALLSRKIGCIATSIFSLAVREQDASVGRKVDQPISHAWAQLTAAENGFRQFEDARLSRRELLLLIKAIRFAHELHHDHDFNSSPALEGCGCEISVLATEIFTLLENVEEDRDIIDAAKAA